MDEEEAKLNPAEAWDALYGALVRDRWRRDGCHILSGHHVSATAASESEAQILYLLLARSGPRLLEAYRAVRDSRFDTLAALCRLRDVVGADSFTIHGGGEIDGIEFTWEDGTSCAYDIADITQKVDEVDGDWDGVVALLRHDADAVREFAAEGQASDG